MECFVINGKGGCGKDTFCSAISESGEFGEVVNISSIDPVKEVARFAGWDGVKDEKGRRFLSDLKQIMTEYNDCSNKFCFDVFNKNLKNEGVIFVHIREPKEIERFVELTGGRAKTLLVKTKRLGDVHYGNASDDEAENFEYDYVYNNDCSLEDAPADMVKFFSGVMACEQEKELPHGEGCGFSRLKDLNK